MKSWIVPVLAATAVTLGACATTAEESAALSPDQMKAELAAVSQEITEFDAWMQAQRVMGRDVFALLQSRPVIGRLTQLVERRDQLRADLAEVGYPRNAEEVRERIAEIDRNLVKRGAALAPVGAPGRGPSDTMSTSISPKLTVSLQSLPSAPVPVVTTTYSEGPAPESAYVVARPVYRGMTSVPGSASARSSDWRRTYRLKQERSQLLAKLRAMENFEN